MNPPWQAILKDLEATRRRLVDEIVHYPPPIPRCDVQYNTLLEERAGVARELYRAQELSQGAAGENAAALADFVRMSMFLSDHFVLSTSIVEDHMSNSTRATETRVSNAAVAAEAPAAFVPAPAQTRIGHIHLRVANLERAIHFYHDLLGFDLLTNMGSAAFLSAGGYHHHIGLNTWESKDGQPPATGTTGLYHFAINYPERKDLAAALARLLDNGWGIDGASDHGTHEAIYLHDPDFNGIEFAWDRPQAEWPRMGDAVTFSRKSLDFKGLLAELGGQERTAQLKSLEPYT